MTGVPLPAPIGTGAGTAQLFGGNMGDVDARDVTMGSPDWMNTKAVAAVRSGAVTAPTGRSRQSISADVIG